MLTLTLTPSRGHVFRIQLREYDKVLVQLTRELIGCSGFGPSVEKFIGPIHAGK